jgi:hypothetical protein
VGPISKLPLLSTCQTLVVITVAYKSVCFLSKAAIRSQFTKFERLRLYFCNSNVIERRTLDIVDQRVKIAITQISETVMDKQPVEGESGIIIAENIDSLV